MKEKWRLLLHPQMSGDWHMAADVTLAQQIGRHLAPATFRAFSWSPATISVGHNQRQDALDLHACRSDGLRVVRRPTGGRAILHCDEITYSAIFPVTSRLYAPQLLANYLKISKILKAALEPFGLLFDPNFGDGTQTGSEDSELCFARALSYELTIGGKKLVGSAQRRWATVVLQHGSILLGPCHEKLGAYLKAPESEREAHMQLLRQRTTFVKRYLPQSISLEEFARSVQKSFEIAGEVCLEPGSLTPDEEQAIRELAPTFRIL